jgi:hypothetical protein
MSRYMSHEEEKGDKVTFKMKFEAFMSTLILWTICTIIAETIVILIYLIYK